MFRPWLPIAIVAWGFTSFLPAPDLALAQTIVSPTLALADTAIRDQDDMCVWIHPTDRSLSTIITSDKAAGKLFVYDLQGNTIQVVDLPGSQPGGVDVRYHFDLQGKAVDIVAFNDRNRRKLQFYQVDPLARTLHRIDNDAIGTASSNYGMCLYVSPVTGKYYVYSVTENGIVEQFELFDDSGQLGATLVRTWDLGGQTEGVVCDDEVGVVFMGEEDVGIWKLGAEPEDPIDAPTAIATVGDTSGIEADVEGLALYYAANGEGYLIASSQGDNSYRVYARKSPHAYVGSFKVVNATGTDGIDVTNVNLGPAFPNGLFALHNDRRNPRVVNVCAYEDLGLSIDTDYWDPREGPGVDTQIALASARAEPGRVQLTWYGNSAAGMDVTVYRRTLSEDWAARSIERVDGSGQLVYVDESVRAGTRYGYRLGLTPPEGPALIAGEVWVSVPDALQLGIHGARPNPVERDLVVAFALRDHQRAELELFDLSGRRRWSRRVDSLGPGSHVLPCGRIDQITPGVYLLRLTQGETSVAVRVAFIR